MIVHTIAGELTKRGIKTPGGKDRWNQSTVRSILANEKYKGDALLQKSCTVDFLTKKTKTNEGEVPQYYVENNHEAIIAPQIYCRIIYQCNNNFRNKTYFLFQFSAVNCKNLLLHRLILCAL